MAEKTYKNVSGAPVLGNAPGKVFTADIPDVQLKRMIARGSIKEVEAKAATEQVAPEETADSPETDENAGSGDGDKKVEETPPTPPVPPAAPRTARPGEKKG